MIKHHASGRVYFTEDELKCKGSGLCILDPLFAKELLGLRVEFDEGMTSTSCCRSKAHNEAEGGHPRSFHVCDEPFWEKAKGAAAIDIKMRDGRYNLKLVRIASKRGWSVGINFRKKFIHLDRRVDFVDHYTTPVLFSY